MPIAQNLTAFNAGEFSPLLDARVDIEKYASGCRELRNFITTPYGPNMRRPGTEHGGEIKDSTKRGALEPFVFSDSTQYQMEFGQGFIRFWDQDTFSPLEYGPQPDWTTSTPYNVGDFVTEAGLQYRCLIAHTSGVFATDLASGDWIQVVIQEVQTSYLESDLPEIQFVQINDLAYFTHPLRPPFMISRRLVLGSILFTGQDTVWDWPPLLEENTDAIELEPSATTGSINILAYATGSAFPLTIGGPFNSNQIGSFLQIAQLRTTSTISKTFAANGSSASIGVFGSWTLNTYGTWAGTLTVERSYDGGANWSDIRSYTATSDHNISVAGNEPKPCLLRLTFSNRTVGTSADRALLILDDPLSYGLVKITGVVSSGEITATVISDLYSTDRTTQWSQGAWGEYQGYPRAISVFQNRVLYGGTNLKPQSIWGTKIDDYQNFRLGILGDDGLFFTIASNRQSIIQWMASKDEFLHVGRQGSEGRLSASDSASAISPGDIQWTPTTSYGSKHLPSVILNDALLFVQGQGRKIRSLAQVPNTAAFSGQDVTILSEHITKGEIVEYSAQNLPDAILWCIRGDGVLLGMSYDSLSSVVAWHRHDTQGFFESVSVIPGEFGDEVWFIVRRVINGVTKRFIERFRPGWREVWEDADKDEWWYLDCATRVVNIPASKTVAGLSHLEGATLRVLSDGADLGEYTVSGGQITLTTAGGVNTVGLSYDSVMRTMKLNSDTRNGTSQGRKVKIDRVVARLLRSLGGQYSTDGVNYSNMPTRSAQDNLDESPPVFTGDTGDLVDRGNHRQYAEIWIKQSAPVPLTVLSIVAKWTPSSD